MKLYIVARMGPGFTNEHDDFGMFYSIAGVTLVKNGAMGYQFNQHKRSA